MSKITIIEGNSNDKDQIRTYLVKGEKGDKGDTGPIGDNQLTIGTVTSGETASAEITGTSPNQTLNLVLPKGDTGETGQTGPQGPAGFEVPTGTIIGFDGEEEDIPDGYEVFYGFGMPIGSITGYGGLTAPEGFLMCDGTEVNIEDYPLLYDVIGENFGTSSLGTSFKLPNLKSRFPVGYDNSDTSYNTIGKTGGEKTHTLTVDEMPSHTHVQNPHNHQAGSMTLTYDGSYLGVPSSAPTTAVGYDTTSTTATNQNTGGGQAHNNLPPYIAINFIIKAY